MSKENTVSISIPAADVTKVTDALKMVITTMKASLISLTDEERKALPKMNDKTTPFVEKALAYAQSNPEFAPSYLNIAELKKDVELVKVLTVLERLVDQLNSGLDNTIMKAGSEAYVAALSYYNSVKQAAKANVAGAKPIFEDLKKRFENNGPRSEKEVAK